MLLKDIAELTAIDAGDHSELREILHPERDNVRLRYSLALAILKPDETSVKHRLGSSEVYYVLSGTGVMHIDDETETVHAGHTVYIPPDSVQWLENTGRTDLAFLCLVDPAWRQEDEKVLE